ncbi:MAG: MiaB/RimO family radical SAM methylthiotransferase [Chloroflexi bacterium]|nr:MiaB/RimO family radical SAM methylthiotransferase [Chloroflexota bacterium]
MSSYYIWTVGCQMNKADSERLAASLEEAGYASSSRVEDADLVILNSCAVRQSAENRVIGKLSTLKRLKAERPSLLLALTGCMVDYQESDLRRRFPYVDAFFKPQAVGDLLGFVGAAPNGQPALPARPSVCAFVPIIQGCDNFCTYCIVPFRRGREKSRPPAEIRCEVERLVARGVREVTLLGQNVDSYGHDLANGYDLARLLQELNTLPGLERIRFLTSHPEDMTRGLIEAVAGLEKVCEHVNLPLQSGDDDILQAMRRAYTVSQYCDLAGRIRTAIPGVSLSTDIIVGFPGETEEQFRRTAEVLGELRFDTVHVAAYSPRVGTAAARMEDSVPFVEKKRRLDEIEALQEGIAAETNAKLLGAVEEVLVEGQRGGKWFGRTRTNKLVFFCDAGNRYGQMVDIVIEKASPWALQGSLRGRKEG